MTVEQSHAEERFPGCPTPEEINLVQLELRKASDPEQRKAILSQFLGGLDPDIEFADHAAHGDDVTANKLKTAA